MLQQPASAFGKQSWLTKLEHYIAVTSIPVHFPPTRAFVWHWISPLVQRWPKRPYQNGGERAECRLWQQFVGKPYSATVSAQGYRGGDRNTDCSNYKPQNQTRIIMGGWKYFISIGWCELVMLNPSPASRFNCVASKQHLQRILQYKIIPTKNLNFWPNFGSMLFQAVRPVWL